MLGSYWRIIIAAVGLVLLGATPPEQPHKQSQATEQVTRAPPDNGGYAPYPNKYAESCYRAQEHDTADLCAQWRAAIAAEKAADTAWWGNAIGVIGAILSFLSVVLVVFALRQTEKSLTIAQRDRASATRRAIASGQETEAALAIAERQVQVAEDTARRQLRAYLSAGEVRLEDNPEHGFTVSADVKNDGTTPALITGAFFLIGWRDESKTELHRSHFNDNLGIIAPPGQERTITLCVQAATLEPNFSAFHSIMASFVVRYEDCFGDAHETVFSRVILLADLLYAESAIGARTISGDRAT